LRTLAVVSKVGAPLLSGCAGRLPEEVFGAM
jgi:hypothetical protein